MMSMFFFFFLFQIECSSISDYAIKIVKANKMDNGGCLTVTRQFSG